MRLEIILVKIFFLAALIIISNGNLALHDSANRAVFYERYSAWFSDIMDKGFEITGYVVNTEWLPEKHIVQLSFNNTLQGNG